MHEKKFDPSKPVVINTPASPGPTSIEGKAISSRNATKHGSCANDTLILPNESPEEFKSLEATWFRAYEPQGEAEIHLVRQLVHADWFFQRTVRNYAEAEARIMAANPDILAWTEEQHKALTRFQRYRTANQNIVAKHRKALQDFRKNRTSEKQAEQKQIIATERHAAFKQRNKPEPTFEETVDLMRRQALALGFAPEPTTVWDNSTQTP